MNYTTLFSIDVATRGEMHNAIQIFAHVADINVEDSKTVPETLSLVEAASLGAMNYHEDTHLEVSLGVVYKATEGISTAMLAIQRPDGTPLFGIRPSDDGGVVFGSTSEELDEAMVETYLDSFNKSRKEGADILTEMLQNALGGKAGIAEA